MDIFLYIFICIASFFIARLIDLKVKNLDIDFMATQIHNILKEKDPNLKISDTYKIILKEENSIVSGDTINQSQMRYLRLKFKKFYILRYFNLMCYFTLVITLMFFIYSFFEKFCKYLFL